jgi:hypothetical protein
MADEVSIGISFSCTLNGDTTPKSHSFTADVAGDAIMSGIQEIGTGAEEVLVHGDVGTFGWVYLHNLDSTNFITAGFTGAHSIKLLAGKACIFPSNGADIYCQADTAVCNVAFAVVEL